ncbi:MAG: hypothetical protein K0R47_4292 [Brevibacillus sp.]|jgi:hypothetical protein|nr:hypothetical protein [Brevibacillus sp.]
MKGIRGTTQAAGQNIMWRGENSRKYIIGKIVQTDNRYEICRCVSYEPRLVKPHSIF